MTRQRAGWLALWALLGGFAIAGAARAEPFVPASDQEVLERLPASGRQELRALAERRAELAAHPTDLELALSLAMAYARLGRREGDPRYDGYAQAALAPWWDRPAPPLPVLLLRATLLQRRHAFAAALVDLDAVLRRAPSHPQAWLTRAMVLAVQGQPRAALEACERLTGSVPALLRAGCMAHAGGLGGQGRESYRQLAQSLDEAADAAPEIRLWALTILAELAIQRGDAGAAERHFRAALALGLRDPYLLGAYADFLLDQDRPTEVVMLLAGETGIDPLLLRLALAESRLGTEEVEDHVGLLRARFDAARRRGDSVHLREQARFALELLGQPAEALRLALANWRTQREPADARLVLEAALAVEDRAAAQPVLDWLARTGQEDLRLRALADRLEGAV